MSLYVIFKIAALENILLRHHFSDTISCMIITQYGIEFFKIQTGDVVLAFNPIGKKSSHKTSRFGADVAFVSLNHEDFNGVDNVAYKDKEPLVISGPGEYETRGIFVKGFGTKTTYKGDEYINTIYSVQFDGINLCFLGALSSSEDITSAIKEGLGDIDVLFVPIGGEDVLESGEAYKVSVSLAPHIIIPMHMDGSKKDETVKAFLKDAGNDVKPVDKLTLKKKDLEGKEGDIIILKPVS